jgi:hypothetical protein
MEYFAFSCAERIKMAQPTSSVIDVWFYVNPETQAIDAAYCFTPLGILDRVDSDWAPTTREDSRIDELSGDDVYQLDWSADKSIVINDEFDFDNYDSITPKALKLYDSGELTLDVLKENAELLRSNSEVPAEDN